MAQKLDEGLNLTVMQSFNTGKCSVLSEGKNFPQNNYTLNDKYHKHSIKKGIWVYVVVLF